MITPLDIPTARVSPCPLPPGGLDLLVAASAREGRARHLRDLLTGADADGSVYLAHSDEVRAMLNRGIDPQLYLAYRDIAAPRPKTGQPIDGAEGTHTWFADLVVYTAAFIAEIVRSGIQAVPWGQWEAAGALGLRRGRIMRLVVLPQALRVIVPPMTSQYLNITKNSSLAVAIGYPEIVSIAGTTLNQTGQAIEGVAIIMAVYLTISLSISLFMNWYNRAIALVER